VWHDPPVNWIVWLGLAVLVTAVAAITGIKAKGTRPVASSRLMGVGRFILLLLVLVFAYFAFRARSGS
jgi:F0F1-type ATP synthase membrane subunit a